MVQIARYVQGPDGAPLDFFVGVGVDASGNLPAKLLKPVYGPDGAVLPMLSFIQVDANGNPIAAGSAATNATPPGTSSITRTLAQKASDLVDGRDYGISAGNSDNTSALNWAFGDINSGAVPLLRLPPGYLAHGGALTTITRTGATLIGFGKRTTILRPTANVDCIHFAPVTPLTAVIGDITAKEFGIDYGAVTAPTAGVGLTIDRATRSHFDVDINSGYQGMLVRGGAGTNEIGNATITGAFSWTALAVGSYLVKFTNLPGTTETSSEWNIGAINWKGSGSNGNGALLYLENGLIIECTDGLFFSIGHLGFAYNRQIWVNPQAAGLSTQTVDFGKINVDGNSATSPTGAGLEFSGSTVGVCQGFDASGMTFENISGRAIVSTLTTLRNVKLGAKQSFNIGKQIIDVNGAQGVNIGAGTITNGNTANTAGIEAIKLTAVTDFSINVVNLLGGTNTYPVGVSLNACLEGTIVGNTTRVTTTDYSVASNCDRITWTGNQKAGTNPVVASASPSLILPMGFLTFTVTGTVAMTGIQAPNIEDYRFTAFFASAYASAFSGAASNIRLAGGVAFSPTAGSSIEFLMKGGIWYEQRRAIM